METVKLIMTIVQVLVSLALIISVIFQSGKHAGMSGSIDGVADTFFGKNKGRTVDAMLKKFTAVFAILFVISSLALTALSAQEYKADVESAAAESAATAETGAEGEAAPMEVSMDENGNMVDAEGNIIMTAEQMAEQQAAAEAEGAEEAPAEEAPATEEAPAEEAPATEEAAE